MSVEAVFDDVFVDEEGRSVEPPEDQKKTHYTRIDA